MKAVAFTHPGPIEADDSLVDLTLPPPTPAGHDLLVEVRAVSVNPVDTKVRSGRIPLPDNGEPHVIGWDAAGVVVALADEATGFAVGDEVFYAGELTRPGSNAEYQAVDCRIVGHKPTGLDFADAAALPLTGITAWELLFDRLEIPEGPSGDTLLVTGAAGGVGSILVQLARKLTGLTVIGTASRPETTRWAADMGCHHVIDHSRPMPEQVRALGLPPVRYIASLTETGRNYEQLVEILAPQGKLALIDDPPPLDIRPLKRKSASVHWELMFARSLHETPDLPEQGRLLDRIADLVDRGEVRPTRTRTLTPINATTLKQAHALVETGRMIGKLTLRGF